MKTILVPTDFSKPAQWALDVAAGIAQKSKSRIVLLHVVEQPTGESFNVEAQVSDDQGWEEKLFSLKLIERSKLQLDQAAKRLEDQGILVTCELRLGNPYHGIRTIVTEHEVDLVVMGASGKSRLEEILIGSNAEKVVRHSKCPVLSVHEAPAASNFANIVVASSLNDNEREFGRVIQELQKVHQAKLHIVRINTPMNFQPDHQVKRVMKDFVKKLGIENYTLNIYNDRSEEEGILNFAASIDADLITMATHGRTGLPHALIGSIAEDVVNHSRRPVLTYVTPGVQAALPSPSYPAFLP